MKKTLLTLAILGTLGTLPLLAQTAETAKPDWTLTGNAGLASDYRFRGFTQTGYQPAFQGGFDAAHKSGFYVGNWNSNVEQALYRGATLEMDIYGGYKFEAAGMGVDLGAITCRYPTRADTGNLGAVHHDELYLGLSFAFLSVKYSYGLSNYFGLGDGTAISTKGNSYLDLSATKDLGHGWGINAHYGHQAIRNATNPAIGLKDSAVDDYKLGVTKDLKGWVLNATYIGTSRSDYFTTGISAPEAAGHGAIVVGLSKTF
jgi:uncharacterized protein (TIGR02001 family)